MRSETVSVPVVSPAADAPIITRTETLRRLCVEAKVPVAKILAKAQVGSAEEMGDRDFQDAINALENKIAEREA